jgi:hypothetical protein
MSSLNYGGAKVAINETLFALPNSSHNPINFPTSVSICLKDVARSLIIES